MPYGELSWMVSPLFFMVRTCRHCVAVSFANARAFEAGDTKILRLQVDGQCTHYPVASLVRLPIILYSADLPDLLVDHVACDVEDEHAEWDKERIYEEAQSLAIPKRNFASTPCAWQVQTIFPSRALLSMSQVWPILSFKMSSCSSFYPRWHSKARKGYGFSIGGINSIGRIILNRIAGSVWLV